MKHGIAGRATRYVVAFIFLAGIPVISLAAPTIRANTAAAHASQPAVVVYIEHFFDTVSRGAHIVMESFSRSLAAVGSVSKTSVTVTDDAAFVRPTPGQIRPGLVKPPFIPPPVVIPPVEDENPPTEPPIDPPTVPPKDPATVPPTVPPESTTTPPSATTTTPFCLSNERALMLDGETVACVSVGALDTLEARQYGFQSELPPRVILRNGNERNYLLTTSFSNVCRSTANYLNQSVYFSDCDTVLMEDLAAGISSSGVTSYETNPDDAMPWRRSYSGILTALPSKNKVVGIVHGENQNIRRGSQTYLNTVREDIDPSCVAGYDANGVWQNCWTQFSSFANLVWWDKNDFLNGETPHDLGPVLWNHRSYAESGGGPYHPTLFKNDSYFYLYSVSSPSWGWPCLTVARASIKSNGLPNAFSTLSAGGSFSQAGLPSGFSLSSIREFYDTTVAEPACLFDATYSGTWFSVARITGTPYYLSLEERYLHSPETAEVVLRVSEDPGNWKDSTGVALEERPGAWGVLDLTYPMFSDENAAELGAVNAASFFIVGNSPGRGYELHALPLSLRLL